MAKAKRVVGANLRAMDSVQSLRPMPELAKLATYLAKATFVVGTLLLLFDVTFSRFLWVSVDTVSVHLLALASLLEKLADRNLLFVIKVQVFALVALATHLFEPVNTHFLLKLGVVRARGN